MVSKSLRSVVAVAAFAALVGAQDIPTPTAIPPLNAPTLQGCFSSSDGLDDHGPWTWQSQGNCQPICVLLEKPVMALVNGTNCYCGSFLPPANSKVSDDECNTPCIGYPLQTCGGKNRWQVWLDGINKDSVSNYDPKNPNGGKPSGTKTGAQVVTVGGSTVIMTVPPSSNKGSSPASKAGIAAGVVVGIVVLAAIVGGVFFFLRQRRRKEVEEEYRRAAAINDFVSKSPQTSHSSITDARLDPEVMFRRQSDGSIADNQDYSRRILQVRNPDGL